MLQRTLAEILGLDAGLLPRPRRVDAPAVVRGGRARHERDRRRRRADGGRQRLGAAPCRDERSHHQLLRRRRREHRLRPRDDEPRRGVGPAVRLLHREQPLRGVHRGARGHRGVAALGSRTGLRHPRMAGRRDGSPRRPPRDRGGDGPHARRRRPGGHRGRGLPLLPPERPVPGQRLRLPQQGRGDLLARPGSDRPDDARAHGARDRLARPRRTRSASRRCRR